MKNLTHIGETRIDIDIQNLSVYLSIMGNTEGSRAISQVYRARKNLILRLSKRQMAVLLGSILGDSYIYPQGKICLEHAQTQKNYLLWKYAQLKSLAYPKVSQVVRTDRRSSRKTISWRFFLKQFFRPLRNSFYVGNRKVVPESLSNWLSPLLLAVWYMDDGYLERGNPLLMTENFELSDVQRLVAMISEKFKLNCLITSKRRIRIRHSSSKDFFQIIEPFIHKDLRYKLP